MARRRGFLARYKARYDMLVRAVVLSFFGWIAYWAYEQALQPITVGILFPQTGSLAVPGREAVESVRFAIEHLNEQGGILGRRIVPIAVDASYRSDELRKQIRKLVESDGVSAIFGCLSASCRRTAMPIIDELESLLVYPFAHEGLDTSEHLLHTGTVPNQLLLPGLRWSFDNLGTRFFLLGTDDVYSRVGNALLRQEIELRDGEVVGEAYLGTNPDEGKALARTIIDTQPSVVLNLVQGDANIPVYKTLQGLMPDSKRGPIPTLFLLESAEGLSMIGAEATGGNFLMGTYFPTVDNRANKAFLELFKERYGTSFEPDSDYEASYVSVKLWAEGVRRAHSAKPVDVKRSIEGVKVEAPSGDLEISRAVQHTSRRPMVAAISRNGELTVVWQAEEPVEPKVHAGTWTPDQWNRFLQDLYRKWGDEWSAPGA